MPQTFLLNDSSINTALLYFAFMCMYVCMLSRFSHVWLHETPWTVVYQAPPSMGFSRQEYWSGLPCPPPGDLPDPGIKLVSVVSAALAGGFLTSKGTWEAPFYVCRLDWYVDELCLVIQLLIYFTQHFFRPFKIALRKPNQFNFESYNNIWCALTMFYLFFQVKQHVFASLQYHT